MSVSEVAHVVPLIKSGSDQAKHVLDATFGWVTKEKRKNALDVYIAK
jgi:hypothetical protein